MDNIVLLLFLLQQLGMTLAVGASTFALLFYIAGIADGQIDTSEARFMRTAFTMLRLGLFLIIITGAVTTGAHYLAGDLETLLQPAFLFKWLLLVIIIINSVLMDLRIVTLFVGGMLSGASWYALFVIHTLAPISNWFTLSTLYVAWLIVFGIGFYTLRAIAVAKYKRENPADAAKPAISQNTSSTSASSNTLH